MEQERPFKSMFAHEQRPFATDSSVSKNNIIMCCIYNHLLYRDTKLKYCVYSIPIRMF